jgi:hypothetical protein
MTGGALRALGPGVQAKPARVAGPWRVGSSSASAPRQGAGESKAGALPGGCGCQAGANYSVKVLETTSVNCLRSPLSCATGSRPRGDERRRSVRCPGLKLQWGGYRRRFLGKSLPSSFRVRNLSVSSRNRGSRGRSFAKDRMKMGVKWSGSYPARIGVYSQSRRRALRRHPRGKLRASSVFIANGCWLGGLET